MGMEVYANGMSIACKAAAGKTIAAMPDVCLSPPTPPAGPVPIPYPNTAMASDTTNGSKTVQINSEEVMLKDQSTFKKSNGDEAATKTLGMGVVTACIQGEVSFVAYSMDVKFEGANIPRHMDLTLHNEQCVPANTPPWMYADMMAFNKSGGQVCKDEKDTADKACKKAKTKGSGKTARRSCSKACKKAQKCVLVSKSKDKELCCAPENTGHHLVEVHCFTPTSGRSAGARLRGFAKYEDEDAPCVCASRSRFRGTHGICHSVQGMLEAAYNASATVLKKWSNAGSLIKGGGGKRNPAVSKWNYGQARDAGAMAHKKAFPHCNAVCVRNQLDEYHKDKCGLDDDTPLRTDTTERGGGPLSSEAKKAVTAEADRIRGVTTSGTSK